MMAGHKSRIMMEHYIKTRQVDRMKRWIKNIWLKLQYLAVTTLKLASDNGLREV
jgi:hypothetical protein